MKRSKFTEQQIAFALQQAESGTQVAEVCRKMGISEATFYPRLKPPRRRVMAKLRDDRSHATGPNQVWAMDWMHDELFDGRRVWVLTVVDTWSRVYPGQAGLSIGDCHGGHRCARASSTAAWPANDDSCRPGKPVHLEGARSMGLCERHHAGLQPPRQAHRQRLRRKLQRHGSAGVPRPALVPGSGRCLRKGRRMACRVQWTLGS
jgi:hypothetical protein